MALFTVHKADGQTDGRTDGIGVAYTCYSIYAVARKKTTQHPHFIKGAGRAGHERRRA